MAIESKRMRQIRGTASAWSSANTVLGAGEIGIETDTNKMKIGDGTTAWNSLGYHTHAWSEITSKPSTFTPANHTHSQSDITNLSSDLAAKANVTHTHDAANITTGTMATARLASGTANATTFLRGDQTWAVPPGTGNGTSTTLGSVYDVRTYGALTGFANATATQAAFQAAVDAANAAGGGTVYVPATTSSEAYYIRTPVWSGANNVAIVGEGSHASRIVSYGPAFVTTGHPKTWDCQVTTYTDVDTSATVTVKTSGILTDRSRYRMDITRFASGGDFPPGGSRPALGVASSPNNWFGLRTRGGVVGGRFPLCSLATGENNGGSNFFTQWEQFETIEWNFVVYHHQASLKGGIAGSGSIEGPDPWILVGDGGNYYFDLALTDQDGIRRTYIRCYFPQVEEVGLHRITIQFDPNAAVDADRIRASVDRTRVTVTRQNISDQNASYHAMNTSNNSGDFTDLWTVWNRVARWCGSDFMIANEDSKVGIRSGLITNQTDYTVLLASCHKEFKHAFGSIGSTITKVGGAPADDSAVWVMTTGAQSDASAIGWVANEITNDWSPANGDNDMNLKAWGKGRSPCWGYMHPKANPASDAITETRRNMRFERLSFSAWDNHQNSTALLIGACLNTDVEDCWFRDGFYFSLSMLRNRVCYPLRFRNLRFSKGVHLSDCSIWGENWVFDYARNCAILTVSTELTLRDLYGLDWDTYATGIIRCYSGGGLGAGIDISKANFNVEGLGIHGPNGPVIYYQKHYNHPQNRVILDQFNVGEPAGPSVYIDDTMPNSPAKTLVRITNSGFGSGNTMLTVRGKDVTGEVEIGPHHYSTDVNEYLPNYGSGSSHPQFAAVKTIDRKSYGLPPGGGFVNRMHEIHVLRPSEGYPSKWAVSHTDNTSEVYLNGSTQPTFIPIEYAQTGRYQHALSADIVGGTYATCSIPWPTSSTTTLDMTVVTNSFAKKILGPLLAGSGASNRSAMTLRWCADYVSHISTGLLPATFFSAENLTTASQFAAATSREKATNTPITITGNNTSQWDVRVRRKWSWILAIGENNVGTGATPMAAIVGKTNRVLGSSWFGMAGNNYTISSGNLRVGMRSSKTGFVDTVANQILDYMMNGSFPSGIPATLYVGLSKTEINMNFPIATEPNGNNYARVGVTRNTSSWGELFDSGYIFANLAAITFAAPTGDWGVVTHVVLFDSLSGGSPIAAAPLNRPARITGGDQGPVFLPGSLHVQL